MSQTPLTKAGAERLRAEGYEVPSAQDLKEINERLRNLPDAE